jgi:hypothetical protein
MADKDPTEVEILGRRCPITWDASLKADPGEVPAWGEYERHECRISIDKRVPDVEFRLRTLIHEMVHAGLDVSGLTEFLEDKMEEAICTVMEQVIVPNIDTLYKISRFIPKRREK